MITVGNLKVSTICKEAFFLSLSLPLTFLLRPVVGPVVKLVSYVVALCKTWPQ